MSRSVPDDREVTVTSHCNLIKPPAEETSDPSTEKTLEKEA